MRILAINSGSSSLKFSLFEADATGERLLLDGTFEGIGEMPGGHVKATEESVGRALQAGTIDAVAHRVVHGGPELRTPTRIDDAVRARIEAATTLAPLHNPAALAAIDAAREALPGVSAVAVFDTGFHATMPDHAALYAIDPALADRHAIRRYGFHGIAHAYMVERHRELTGGVPRLVTLQLGSGCSMAAVRDGVCIDTSMGLTPLEGLIMETRSGDVDPSLIAYLARVEGLWPDAAEELLNRRSGLLGIAGERDMRRLLAAEAGDAKAALALRMFVYRIQKYIGAYAAALGGLDAVVFGGGIGENAAPIRERVLDGLSWLGVRLDAAANGAPSDADRRISAPASSVEAWVIAVDEERMLAREAYRLLSR